MVKPLDRERTVTGAQFHPVSIGASCAIAPRLVTQVQCCHAGVLQAALRRVAIQAAMPGHGLDRRLVLAWCGDDLVLIERVR